MGLWTGKTEGGNKRGHSNMTHWCGTAIIKRSAKRHRRQDSKRIAREALQGVTN